MSGTSAHLTRTRCPAQPEVFGRAPRERSQHPLGGRGFCPQFGVVHKSPGENGGYLTLRAFGAQNDPSRTLTPRSIDTATAWSELEEVLADIHR